MTTIVSSDAMARLKMAEPAELSHSEPSRANKLAHDQNGLGLAYELAQPDEPLLKMESQAVKQT